MSVTLIVTKSIDENFDDTAEHIELAEWLSVIANDSSLTIRAEPYATRLPDGQELRVPVLPAQSELTVTGERIPFLGYRDGELVMRLTEDMERPGNPQREKVAEIAGKLGALITHDAGDEILMW